MGGVNVEQAGRGEKRVQVPRLVGKDEIKQLLFRFIVLVVCFTGI